MQETFLNTEVHIRKLDRGPVCGLTEQNSEGL